MPLGLLLVAAALAAPTPTAAPPAPPRPRILVVPFENVPRAPGARATVMETIGAVLERKGFDVLPEEVVERWLEVRRIRYLDSIPADQHGELLASLEADAAVLGSVLAWREDDRDAEVAVAMRLVTPTGRVLWSDARGLTLAGTEGLLGLGRAVSVRGVADRLVEAMLAPLPAGRLEAVPGPDGRLPATLRDPLAWTAGALPPVLPVAVLPLLALAEARDAPRAAEALLVDLLATQAGRAVVPPADLRRAVVATGLRTPGQLTLEQLRELSKEAGTPLFLRGAILAWTTAGDAVGSAPEVELFLELVDADAGRTLWSGLHRRSGSDYEGLLALGGARDPTSVARRVVSELLEAFAHPLPAPPPRKRKAPETP